MSVLGAAAIKGGASLLGGVLSRQKKVGLQKQYRLKREADAAAERQKYQWIVEGAQKAGFNPLTALKAGGGGLSGGSMTPMQSPLTARAALGEAIETFGGTYAQDAIDRATDARAQEDWKERLDYENQSLPAVSATSQKALQSLDAKNEADQNVEDLLVAIRMPDGSIREMPVGPDLDELITGGAIFVYDKGRDLFESWRKKTQEPKGKTPPKRKQINGPSLFGRFINAPVSSGGRTRTQTGN